MTINGAAHPASIEIIRHTPIPHLTRAQSTGGRTVYAVGDVHGCYDLLTALLGAIVADVATLTVDVPPLLIFCGDYVDRGVRSFDVVDTLVWLSRHAAIEITFLRGNHEAMLLGFLGQPDRHLLWLRRDGEVTLKTYGVRLLEDDVECWRLRDELMDRMPASHFRLLSELLIRRICGDYIFVHAGLRPRISLARQEDEDCLWIREDFLDSDYRFEKVVVHGHSWSSDAPEITSHRIGVDTGAYATGVLTAARLEGSTVGFIQARVSEAGRLGSSASQLDDGSKRL